jgi:hypothetical protein
VLVAPHRLLGARGWRALRFSTTPTDEIVASSRRTRLAITDVSQTLCGLAFERGLTVE